ncbi:hypothetical protein CN345_01655 [Bacillus thuringiensis]|uniref:hypothetical protein n=1 Tax=Bacillus thuringiensis TaxID=1428 RepID=UPI000BF982C8|nr:hypothetical protein [Bacillus thuringiensis]PEZ46360.1 hypothetical protein CN345_01655 [Bacillus thuringiensis]PGY62885.1 hypothetical protein COE09_03585 [Bacillus thuringiensis]
MSNKELTDGLITSIDIDLQSRIPSTLHNLSDINEYDHYFCLHRHAIDLSQWSKNCVILYKNQTRDLENTSLTDADKYEMMKGWSQIFRLTIENWMIILNKERTETND